MLGGRIRRGRRSMMAKMRGTILACRQCGMEVQVVKDCGCDPCEVSCCGEQMKAKRARSAKSRGSRRG